MRAVEEGYWLYLFTTSEGLTPLVFSMCYIPRVGKSISERGKARSVIKTGEWDVIYIFVEIALVHTNVNLVF